MTHPLKFRLHILEIKEKEGMSYEEVAKRFGVGLSSIKRWSKKPEPASGRNRPATKINREALAQDVELYPDAYQYERAQRFGVSRRGMCDALKRLKISRKKNTTTSQSRRS